MRSKSDHLDLDDDEAIRAFIRANTKLMSPPLVPEIRLHIAEESLPIWRRTEEELGEMNLPPPYWAFAWAGGQALARHILDHPEIVAGRSVIDLGCGCGLAAIAAALSDARDVLAADIDRIALAAARMNADANATSLRTTSEDLLAGEPSPVDVLLVGDLFYERGLAERTLAYARKASRNGALVLSGDPQRSYFPKDTFAAVREFRVPVTRELEDSEIKRTCVWKLTY